MVAGVFPVLAHVDDLPALGQLLGELLGQPYLTLVEKTDTE